MSIVISGDVPIWIEYDPATNRVIKIDINLAPEMVRVSSLFADWDGNNYDGDESLSDVEQKVQDADFTKADAVVTVEHQRIVKL